ncbi:hypothetical protein AMS68_006347 [Peltaster fructicola]|uniref:RING-type domain-containing protein n=1 Tax=Peltaster fructicola TaxID=286661 RepID=A0A6H0Y2G6_9PEZI|nr:hypothetical protein AMS68_006347 [Peltaster fructicola]
MLAVQRQHSVGLPRFDNNKAEQLIADLASRSGLRKHTTRATHDRSLPSALSKKRRDSMLAARGRDVRRERTFVGSECAVCEEPLEHTLRGERILQLSCGHVTHQACLHEYTRELDTDAPQCPTCNAPLGLDPSRGNAADFDNLHRVVRAAATPDLRQRDDLRPTTRDALSRNEKTLASIKHEVPRSEHDMKSLKPPRAEWDWETTQRGPQNYEARKQDYDVQSMATTATATSRQPAYSPIPPPIVTVRSEYPTLSKSKQQQSLTCLVTVEVMHGRWQAHSTGLRSRATSQAPRSPRKQAKPDSAHSDHTVEPTEDAKRLETLKDELFAKVENWHGLDYTRFGKLLLHGTMRVGKDKQSWQDLECFLFMQMLICVKEKKNANASQEWTSATGIKSQTKYALKGSILIKRHLQHVHFIPDQQMLSLSLSVVELPYFHLQFRDRSQLDTWRAALSSVEKSDPADSLDYDQDPSGTDDDDTEDGRGHRRRLSTLRSSSHGPATQSETTALTDYTSPWASRQEIAMPTQAAHVPIDIVVVVPVSATTYGLKNNLLLDSIRFVIANLGERDRLALVTFGSSAGGVPIVGMNTKHWHGWTATLAKIQSEVGKNQRADVVDGANVAMDLLMQRKTSNPLSSIILISDSATSDVEGVDFVVSRAEAAKITISSFGLGLTHKPDTMVELSTRTKGSYTFVKDWMMLRECLAGCLGALQSTSHQNVKVKLHLPEGSPAKFVKINGALQITKRATGRDAEASLGDLRFGDKRDILVQLVIPPDGSIADSPTSDPWEHIISNLEALGGTVDAESLRGFSVEEMPLLQADLSWCDVLRDGAHAQLPRQSLLAITMLPSTKKGARPQTPPIPPHPSVVQRRMELLTSDMLTRALTLTARNQHDRAKHLLTETRSILQGLGKGSLPPLPPTPGSRKADSPETPSSAAASVPLPASNRRTPTPPQTENTSFASGAGIDQGIISALDHDLDNSLEYIAHSQVFNRDSRKSVLQAIGVISTQRGFTYRSPAEAMWANRIPGVQRLLTKSQQWREQADQHVVHEAA